MLILPLRHLTTLATGTEMLLGTFYLCGSYQFDLQDQLGPFPMDQIRAAPSGEVLE